MLKRRDFRVTHSRNGELSLPLVKGHHSRGAFNRKVLALEVPLVKWRGFAVTLSKKAWLHGTTKGFGGKTPSELPT